MVIEFSKPLPIQKTWVNSKTMKPFLFRRIENNEQ